MTDYWNSLLAQISQFPPFLQFWAIVIATFVTEEVAAIATLGFARNGNVGWPVAISAIYLGTLLANSIPWIVGRFIGNRMFEWKLFQGLTKSGRIDSLRHHVTKEGWIAICIARFIPGTRIPLYAAAGILGMPASTFFLSLCLSSLLWILALVGLMQSLLRILRGNPIDLVIAIVCGVGLVWAWRHWKKNRKL